MQQFADTDTYFTQDRELLILFYNGNPLQNSLVGNQYQYGTKKNTNVWLINIMAGYYQIELFTVWRLAIFIYLDKFKHYSIPIKKTSLLEFLTTSNILSQLVT